MLCVPSVPTLTILMGIAGKSTGDAGDAKCRTRSTGPSTSKGRLTSWRTRRNRGCPSRWARFAAEPVTRLSMPTTSQPCSSIRSQRCDAMNPAAPEMTALVMCDLLRSRTLVRMCASRASGTAHWPACAAPASVAADAAVDEAQAAHLRRVVQVPAVHDDRPAHQALELLHVQLLELIPLRHDHDRVRAPGHALGVAAVLDVRHDRPRALDRRRVVRPDYRALLEQRLRDLHARRLAHVVRVRLERQAQQADHLPAQAAQALTQLLH